MPTRKRTPRGGGWAVGRFLVGTAVAVVVVLVSGFFALRDITVEEAERDSRRQVVLLGRLVASAGLGDGLLRGSQGAIARLDDVVAGNVLSPSVVRVKVWRLDGTVLYSDVPELIGRRYPLDAGELALFENGQARAEVSDLSRPENRFERPAGRLLEAHTAIRTPGGEQVLFETYERFTAIDASAARLRRALLLPLLGGLLALLAFQVPLAASIGRRLRRAHTEREALLLHAIRTSERERQQIAADLHDGVVQDLAGLAFGLTPLAVAADGRGATAEATVVRSAMSRLRQTVRDMRSFLVELHPPTLETEGLEAALRDLASSLALHGVQVRVDVAADRDAPAPVDALLYRVAREALRNVGKHAAASTARVAIEDQDGLRSRLTVADDGRGFAAGERRSRRRDGHLGLTLLEEIARHAGGTLAVDSRPGAGTTVRLDVPWRA